MSTIWFITGAGSGIGTGTAKAALRAGDRAVATGRNLEKVRKAYPDIASENIVFVQLDVADEAQAKAAVDEATKRFERIDVLVTGQGNSILATNA
jgi:NAD(P)-dependent dehydrogenase (short-subunit alcohol dehydrogenase family)